MSTTPDQLSVVTSGPAVDRCFGLVFLICGLIAVTAAWQGVWVNDEFDNPQPPVVAWFVGSLCLAAGSVLIFRRKGIEVDRSCQQVTVCWSVLVPLSKRGFSTDRVSEVRVSFNIYDRFAVSLCEHDRALATLAFSRREQALDTARQFAAFLNVPAIDRIDPTNPALIPDQFGPR